MTEITSRLSTALADRYRIERRLGEGGMATVYLAEDLKHHRKVVPPDYRVSTNYTWFDIAPDGRFLMVRLAALGIDNTAGDLIVVENFFEELKAKVGN